MQNYFDNEATSSTLHATMKPARGGKCLVTLSTYEDRKEALLNTTIMDDAGTYRSMGTRTNTTMQDRPKNDTLEGKETKKEVHSHIPKPPPLQMASNGNSYNNNNNNNNNSNNCPQTTSKAKISNKSCALNDPSSSSTPRSSISSQSSNANFYHGNETGSSRSNKTPAAVSNNQNASRQTLRLGSVTIGEYQQPSMRKEPEKFNFISGQKRTRDAGDTTPTNEALQSELQNTLTRANLRKSNGKSYTEHQRNCPLHQQQQQQQLQQRQSIDYGNKNGCTLHEEVTKKLQKSSLNESNATEMLTKANNRATNHVNGTTGVGILKNGSRNGTSSSSKSIEKSIKFG